MHNTVHGHSLMKAIANPFKGGHSANVAANAVVQCIEIAGHDKSGHLVDIVFILHRSVNSVSALWLIHCSVCLWFILCVLCSL